MSISEYKKITFAYMTVQESDKLWNLSERKIQKLCKENQMERVVDLSMVWRISKEEKTD